MVVVMAEAEAGRVVLPWSVVWSVLICSVRERRVFSKHDDLQSELVLVTWYLTIKLATKQSRYFLDIYRLLSRIAMLPAIRLISI